MARCGRCGCWHEYQEGFREKKYAGTCLWYQIRLEPDQVYEDRDCPDFSERVSDWSSQENMEHKLLRIRLREEHIENRIKWTATIVGTLLTMATLLFSTLC